MVQQTGCTDTDRKADHLSRCCTSFTSETVYFVNSSSGSRLSVTGIFEVDVRLWDWDEKSLERVGGDGLAWPFPIDDEGERTDSIDGLRDIYAAELKSPPRRVSVSYVRDVCDDDGRCPHNSESRQTT